MEEQISKIIECLVNHEISKSEAKNQLLFLNSMNFNDPNVKKALNASVSAIYFSDSSDYRAYHYNVIRHLTGLEEINIGFLFNELNP